MTERIFSLSEQSFIKTGGAQTLSEGAMPPFAPPVAPGLTKGITIAKCMRFKTKRPVYQCKGQLIGYFISSIKTLLARHWQALFSVNTRCED